MKSFFQEASDPQDATEQRIRRNRRRLGHNIFLIFLAAIVFFLIMEFKTPDQPYSDTENRPLAQFPTVSLSTITDGSLFTGLEPWFADQFFARNEWISYHLEILKLAGFQDCGGVFLGKDGFLMMKPETPDNEVVSGSIDAMNKLADEHPELHTTAIIVPDSGSVLTDLAPDNMPARDQNKDIAAMESGLSDNITCLDVGAVLSEHTDEYIYYGTDHHWTSLGAYYTFQAAVDALDIRDYATDFDVYTVTDSFQGTLASKSGSRLISDSIDIYLPKSDIEYYLTKGEDHTRTCSIYSSDALEQKDKYTVFFGGNYSIIEIRTTAYNGRKLLVFKDSYANSFIQFLLPCYEEIVMIDPRYYYGSMDELLSRQFTDVLYLYSADNILTSPTLIDVLSSYKQEAGDADEKVADSSAAEDEASNDP